MVYLDGVPYVDGGVGDSIRIVHTLRKGYRKNVVILTRRADYRKKEPSRAEDAFYALCFRKYPELLRAMRRRHLIYNRELDLVEKWEAEGRIFVLRPEMEEVGRLESDVEKLSAFYDHGYDLMKARMDEMMAYLGQ